MCRPWNEGGLHPDTKEPRKWPCSAHHGGYKAAPGNGSRSSRRASCPYSPCSLARGKLSASTARRRSRSSARARQWVGRRSVRATGVGPRTGLVEQPPLHVAATVRRAKTIRLQTRLLCRCCTGGPFGVRHILGRSMPTKSCGDFGIGGSSRLQNGVSQPPLDSCGARGVRQRCVVVRDGDGGGDDFFQHRASAVLTSKRFAPSFSRLKSRFILDQIEGLDPARYDTSASDPAGRRAVVRASSRLRERAKSCIKDSSAGNDCQNPGSRKNAHNRAICVILIGNLGGVATRKARSVVWPSVG